ncbi:hypothetical protein [Corynebacterium striatum]|uniref:hypothetical protein n=1 Tax=Corynebacterium striatum TaxID=43770 RepID=UPI003B5C0611
MAFKNVLITASAMAATLSVDMQVKAANEELPDHREAAEIEARSLHSLSKILDAEAREQDTGDV